MKINKLPFIRWYASDFLAGTRGMKAAEVGIYTILLNLMYEQCEPLQLDIDYLSSQCGCRKQSFLKVLEKLESRKKIILIDGCLWNERVQKEFAFRAKKSQTATQNINERWKKHNEINGNDIQPYDSSNTEKILYQKPEARSQKPSDKEVRTSSSPREDEIKPNDISDLWNKICHQLKPVKLLSLDRENKIGNLIHGTFKTKDAWQQYFQMFADSSFLRGESGNAFIATFDWALNPRNMVKVMDGNYEDRESEVFNPVKQMQKIIDEREAIENVN